MVGINTNLLKRNDLPFVEEEKEYQKKRLEEIKDLPRVPEGTGPKVYCVVCKNASDWNEIHNYIINENEIDGIPNRKIDCTNEYKVCNRMASYEMSDAEAEQLKNHPKVFGVNIDESYYGGSILSQSENDIGQSPRYPGSGSVKAVYNPASSFTPAAPGVTLRSRATPNIYRQAYKDNPFATLNDATLQTVSPVRRGSGKNVDVIVADTDAWYGHIEFIKTGGVGGGMEPEDFIGENALKKGFSASATSSLTGVCGVLDLVLDLPYYLDPEFFEADAGNRLITRWDGTKVPLEYYARAWWNYESITTRSAKFVSTNLTGGTAVIGSKEDFGTVSIPSTGVNIYTRAAMNGSNTTQQTGGGYHGTPCMCLAYGKTQGWAYNAYKWHIDRYVGTAQYFTIIKVFHENKPIQPDGRVNPTVVSNSWTYIQHLPPFDGSSSGYYYYHPNATPSVSNNGVSYDKDSTPAYLNNYNTSYKSGVTFIPSDSTVTLGDDLIEAGVIWVCAAGNDNVKQVLDGHADYDNFQHHSNSSMTLETASTTMTGRFYQDSNWYNGTGYSCLTNRIGMPCQIGKFIDQDDKDVYPAFNIGVLNSDVFFGMEYKASYSNMGEAIDCWCSGSEVIAGCDDNRGSSDRHNRYDDEYRLSSYAIVDSGGTLSDECEDTLFGGTSSACPVAAGMFATLLEYHRDWTWRDIKEWLKNDVTNPSIATGSAVVGAFYSTYSEATTATDTKWNNAFNVQDDTKRKILWDASPFPKESVLRVNESNGLTFSGNGLKITQA